MSESKVTVKTTANVSKYLRAMRRIRILIGKGRATPRRPKPAESVLYAPRSARHVNLNMVALRHRRAKNKVAAHSRRVNRSAK